MTNHQSISFPQAIQLTQILLDQINVQEIDEAEIEQQVSAIVKTQNGARGFFVTYLTSDLPLADQPSQGIINGLKSAIDTVGELLVKNLAMSSAMAISHNRNNDLAQTKSSQQVSQRTSNLIKQINSLLIQEELKKLKTTIFEGKGHYGDFLGRWDYDQEQQQAIQQAITNIL